MAITLKQIIGSITGKLAFERTQENFTTIKDAHNALETSVESKASAADLAAHKAELASKHIKESGTNANGSYIKFDDGTMICYISKTIESLAIATSLGSTSWFQSADQLWNYPATFLQTPTFYSNNNTGGAGRYLLLNRGSSIIKSDFSFLSIVSNTLSVGVHLLAIGRWK